MATTVYEREIGREARGVGAVLWLSWHEAKLQNILYKYCLNFFTFAACPLKAFDYCLPQLKLSKKPVFSHVVGP